MKILVVEDNLINLELFLALLEVKGHKTLKALTGRKALELAQEHKPDIILMDIQLPQVDGWTTITNLRKNEKTKDIPIIALTAHAMTGDREKALNHGCNAYMSKPIDTRNFVSEIEKVYLASTRPE